MSSLPAREIDRALRKKGFVLENSKDRIYRLYAGGRKTRIRTLLSHTSNMDYDDTLLSLVAREMKLTKKELLQFVECTLSGEGYMALLSERGWV